MLNLNTYARFKKDFKLCIKRGYHLQLLAAVVDTLRILAPLPVQNKDRPLSGNWIGHRKAIFSLIGSRSIERPGMNGILPAQGHAPICLGDAQRAGEKSPAPSLLASAVHGLAECGGLFIHGGLQARKKAPHGVISSILSTF